MCCLSGMPDDTGVHTHMYRSVLQLLKSTALLNHALVLSQW